MSKLESDESELKVPLKSKLATACRILAANGHGSALSGQMTARGEKPGTMWTLAYGFGFEEADPSNYLLVDNKLEVLEGSGQPNPANRFHFHVYATRLMSTPSFTRIRNIAPPYRCSVSLCTSHMDTTALYDDVAHLAHWPGIPFGDEEGEIISGALGDKSAILLAHHGQLCVGPTVEAACVLGVTIEQAAEMHLLARAAGDMKSIDPKLGREAHDWRHNPKMVAMTFDYYARLVES